MIHFTLEKSAEANSGSSTIILKIVAAPKSVVIRSFSTISSVFFGSNCLLMTSRPPT